MRKIELIVFMLFPCLIVTVDAARVGVVVDFKDGRVHTSCVEIAQDADGYLLLNQLSLTPTWSLDGSWGHGLCAIEEVGCPASNCYCKGETYWGLYIAGKESNSYIYSPVGFDGGSRCWSREANDFRGHYCVKDGDVLGLRWGTFDDKPDFYSFEEVCPSKKKREFQELEVEIQPQVPNANEKFTLQLPQLKAEVTIYDELGSPIFKQETDEKGVLSLSLAKPGLYKIRLVADDFPHEYVNLYITPEKTDTLSTTSTTTTTTSTSTTQKSFRPQPEASTTTTSTTSTTSTSTTIRQPSNPNLVLDELLEEKSIKKPQVTGEVVRVQSKPKGFWVWLIEKIRYLF